ncbi:MAG: 2-oxo-4-hydroxy-4-carboxy-5-ureidoimidazoline decarboxylase [Chloroflexi bacterium]|nr:MAG: 2-oxo-4-hydroxy-4-carboxy-5-ureidoimidazoline decarboxylase [Chloroflexota bacterium]
MDGIASFNALPRADAEERLLACFANRTWASRVAGGRPYKTYAQLLAAAELAWRDLDDAAWLEAFTAHPRIGEAGGHAPATSEREQSKVMEGDGDTLATLATENREYEARFGHIFLIAAAGRGAGEILAALRERMANDPANELRVAAAEQRKITRLRLEKLLNA